MNCSVCHIGTLENQLVEAWVKRGERWILVQNIDALVCDECGERVFGQDAAALLEQVADPSIEATRPTDLRVFPVIDLAIVQRGTGVEPAPALDFITLASVTAVVHQTPGDVLRYALVGDMMNQPTNAE
jgi:YgiT-type zinc finger domain-containing protein